jgi:hypothetical protein
MRSDARLRKVLRLAEIQHGDLVMVSGSSLVPPQEDGAPRIRVGDVVQCIDRSDRNTLVARPDGSRFRVGHALGMEIEVELFWDPNLDSAPRDLQGRAP